MKFSFRHLMLLAVTVILAVAAMVWQPKFAPHGKIPHKIDDILKSSRPAPKPIELLQKTESLDGHNFSSKKGNVMLADALARMPNKTVWVSAATSSDWSRKRQVSADVVQLPKECLDYLKANRIPDDIVADLQAATYSGFIEIGLCSLGSMREIAKRNQDPANLPSIEHGYLIVASGTNGDPICVHRDTRRIAFISHDSLWEKDYRDFHECVQETPFLYEEFWEKVVFEKGFPRDYYDAKERWSKAP